MSSPSKRKNQPESIDNHGGHLPDYQTMRKRCAYCAMEAEENRTFAICLACSIPICLVKERNCFQKGKKLFSKSSHLWVHIIYTLCIFAKTLWFFVWFLYISTASLSFFLYNVLHMYSYIQYFVFWTSKSCPKDVIFYWK